MSVKNERKKTKKEGAGCVAKRTSQHT
jgi:hypothetical protein